jgi:TatD DNase family protein
MVDVDCNLTHERLRGDTAALLAAAAEAGVAQMVVPGADLAESAAAAELAAAERAASGPVGLFATAGVHPWNAASEPLSPEQGGAARLSALLRRPDVVAVGECGLDASEGFPPIEAQLPWFEAQLRAACESRLPVFLHERLAFDEMAGALARAEREAVARGHEGLPPVLVHCFTGTRRELEDYLARGFYVSFSGALCGSSGRDGARGARLRAAVSAAFSAGTLRLDRVMIETDAPYLGFDGCRAGWAKGPRRRSPNVPTALPRVAAALAECLAAAPPRGGAAPTPAEVARATAETARAFFGMRGEL